MGDFISKKLPPRLLRGLVLVLISNLSAPEAISKFKTIFGALAVATPYIF